MIRAPAPSRTRLLALAPALAPAAFVAVLGPAARPAHAQGTAPIVRLVAAEHFFRAPASAPAGRVTVRLVNRGREPHYALLYRLDAGRGARDFLAWRATRGAAPAWLRTLTGPAPVVGGDSTDVALDLDPGVYLVVCGYPGADRVQHVDKGMLRELRVVEPARAAVPHAAPSVAAFGEAPRDTARPAATLVLADDAFRLRGALRGGRHALAIENHGATVKQALIVRLPAGVGVADEQRWFDEQFRGRRPGVPSGGALRLAPGDRLVVTRRFAPGRYVVLSHAAGPWQTLEFTVTSGPAVRARPGG